MPQFSPWAWSVWSRRAPTIPFAAAVTVCAVCVVANAADTAARGEPPSSAAFGKDNPDGAVAAADAKVPDIDYRKISDAQWKRRLTRQQFQVTRKHGTEPAFSSKLHNSKADGVYVCVCCGQALFDSRHKFDSGTGWPSFYQPEEPEDIGKSIDRKLGYVRTEVHCSRCDAHLGHVFNDAPQTPTGLRYCINGLALRFVDRSDASSIESSPNKAVAGEAGQPDTVNGAAGDVPTNAAASTQPAVDKD